MIGPFPDQFCPTLRTSFILTGDAAFVGSAVITFGTVAISAGAHILTIASHCSSLQILLIV